MMTDSQQSHETPAPEQSDRVVMPFDKRFWLLAYGCVGVCIATLLLTFVFYSHLPARDFKFAFLCPPAAFCLVIGGLCLLRWPRKAFFIFLGVAIAMPSFFEDFSVRVSFMKLYPIDFFFMFTVGVLFIDLIFGKIPFRRIRFNVFVIIFILVGLLGVWLGFETSKNPYDKILGDYRRSFFYFANYFLFLYLIRDFKDVKFLLWTILISSLVTIPVGLLQVAFGLGYVRSPIDAAHVLSWMQCTFLSFSVFYSLAHLMYFPQQDKRFWIGVLILGVMMTIAANFRSTWLGIMLGFGVMFLFFPWRVKMRFMLLGLVSVCVVALGVWAMWDQRIYEDRKLGEEIERKASFSNAEIDINVLWRYQSYNAALAKCKQHPILGSGLGTYLTFHVPTSRGSQQLALNHNVHNSFLWLYMSLGIPGILALFMMHGCYLLSIVRYLRHSKWLYGKTTVMACAGYYIAAMTATFFQNYLEQAVTVTVLSAICALTMLTIYYTPSRYLPARMRN